uniref:Peroxidase 2 n=1 Tax=Mycetinis scorodonius TaxID=182058 RepID=MSP2_MYCSO|nr:RecName: Full=Peroxidase 2; Short=MsP2; Flags: Precursor [Mycetinis scorodonius]CAP53935.1 fungal peroxidase [Mycetinis scorodonius]
MRLTYLPLFAGIAIQSASALPDFFKSSVLKPRRTNSLLINPDAQPDLPTAQQASTAAASVGLNLTDIQGDILIGMKKNKEMFFFFSIADATAFKSHLDSAILPLITSTQQLLTVATQPTTAVNLAFSQTGLNALGLASQGLGDSLFASGQFSGAESLGDPGTSNWVQAFAGTGIHGVFLLASDTIDNVNAELSQIQSILGTSITEAYRLQGEARPDDQQGHEHFGFMDGISNPAIDGFSTALPGQAVLSPGLFLLAEDGDGSSSSRPSWAKDGSLLAFRQLQQRVPEFNKFLADNAALTQGNADLLGARMMGRWKSGAPVDLAPTADDVDLANDPQRNNNFNFTHPDFTETTDQTHCPFSAHIRKTNPRSDFNPLNTANHIIRAGIPYGPEVTDAEASSNTSSTDASLERGLAFVAYQSNIGNGFAFIQQNWVDNANFFFGKTTPPGIDPIIGSNAAQNNFAPNSPRPVSGLDPTDSTTIVTLNTDFVVSRGGEYFFSPSLSAIQNTLSV